MTTDLLIDYDTAHGRAHTTAVNIAFILHNLHRPELAESIAGEPDQPGRARRLHNEVFRSGLDTDLIRRPDGGLTVVVFPEPGEGHKPATADVHDGKIVSRCDCDGFA